MFGDALFYFVLTWYFENVITKEQPYWFFVKKNFWFPRSQVSTESGLLDTDKNIQVMNVGKIYRSGVFIKKEFVALEDISFNIEQGELLSILGHNGAGKTTLTNLMTGLFLPTSGQIYVNRLNMATHRE